jgi:hypothetical protein
MDEDNNEVVKIEVEGEEIPVEEAAEEIAEAITEEASEDLSDEKWQQLIDVVKLDTEKVDRLAERYGDEVLMLKDTLSLLEKKIDDLIAMQKAEDEKDQKEQVETIEINPVNIDLGERKKNKYARH